MSKENEETLLDYEDNDDVQETGAKDASEAKKDHYVGVHSSSFRDFGLKPELMRAIVDNGFEHPSEVQHEVLPSAIQFFDILCQAKSGMGKTAVFVLSTLHQLDNAAIEAGKVSVLVLAHTRELAFQIGEEYKRFSKYLPNVRTSVFMGGIPEKANEEELKEKKPHIVVGSPGRILSLIEKKALDVSGVRHFVMDECDKLLEDNDIRKTVQGIFTKTPHDKQVMMFSATMTPEIRALCKKFMNKDMIELTVGDESKLTLHGLQQYYAKLEKTQKSSKLAELLDELQCNQVVIFVSDGARAKRLSELLDEAGFHTTFIHGGLRQEARLERYNSFRKCEKKILVATNLFGRGIDIERVNVVINYDFPASQGESKEPPADQYLHRVGRAGRFGTKGIAISFIESEEDMKNLKAVQDRFEVPIPELPDVKTIDEKSYTNS